MAIPTDTVGLSLAIASGLLKLGRRIDDIASEEKAVRSDLALPDVPSIRAPNAILMRKKLEAYAERPDLDEARRVEIEAALADRPDQPKLLQLMERYLPLEIEFTVDDPAARTRTILEAYGHVWDVRDDEVLRVMFYIKAGPELRESSVGWRLAMATVDVLAELVVENQEYLIKDEQARAVVSAVLVRFSEGDLEDTVPDARALLKHTLRATLNGALDARDALGADLEWLEMVLGALARARDEAPVSDDFLLGLVQGKGYRGLVTALLREGASYLSHEDSQAYEKILAGVITRGAEIAADDQTGFDSFFRDHWQDLARAALQGVKAQGPVLLEGQSPLLQGTLIAVVGALAEETDRDLLSSDTLVAITEAAVGVVAAKPELLDGAAGANWLRDVVGSLAGVVRDQGVRRVLSAQGLELLLRDTLETLGENPELLIADPGLPRTVVASVLKSLAAVEGRGLDAVASAAVGGALEAIAENPDLMGIPYAKVVSGIAKVVADQTAERKLTGLQASSLLAAVTVSVASNPELFVEAHDRLAQLVVSAVLREAESDPHRLLAGQAVVVVAQRALVALSARGRGLVGDGSATQLAERLAAVVNAGLERASAELGRRLNRPAVPDAIGALIDAWSQGQVLSLTGSDAAFQALFAGLADEAMRDAA